LLPLFPVIFYRRKEEIFIFGDFSWLPKIRAVENNLIFDSFSSKISYFQRWNLFFDSHVSLKISEISLK
jgi:hypothetical protein